MYSTKFLVLLSFTACVCPVKVNVKGSLKLGADVMSVLNKVFVETLSGRRSGGSPLEHLQIQNPEKKSIAEALVEKIDFCSALHVCDKGKGVFVDEYIKLQSKAAETVLINTLKLKPKAFPATNKNENLLTIFEEQLKQCFRKLGQILTEANNKVTESNEIWLWLNLLKIINLEIQESALRLVDSQLRGEPKEKSHIREQFSKNLVTATSIAELKYETRLCSEFKHCAKNYEVTRFMNKLLTTLATVSNEKSKEFIKLFLESVDITKLYSLLREEMANDFKFVLNEMAFSDHVSNIDVMESLRDSVGIRGKMLNGEKTTSQAYDEQILNVVLSDLDHILGDHMNEVSHTFLRQLKDWADGVTGVPLRYNIRQILKKLTDELERNNVVFKDKLLREVILFLVMTVGSE